MKKFISLLLSVVVASSMIVTTAFAAGGEPNAKWDATDITISTTDTFTVLVSTGEKAITIEGIGLTFDNTQLQVVSFTDGYDDTAYEIEYTNAAGKLRYYPYAVSETAALANAQGQFGITFSNNTEFTYSEYDLAKVTFKAAEGFTGDATLKLEENSSGTDGYKGVVDTITVTVEGSTPPPAADITVTPDSTVTAPTYAWNVVVPAAKLESGTLDAIITNADAAEGNKTHTAHLTWGDLFTGGGDAEFRVITTLRNAANLTLEIVEVN